MHSEAACAVCGYEHTVVRSVTRSFGKGAKLLVIEGIPLVSCPNCSASYFTAETLHGVERIKSLRQAVAVSRKVPVAEFHRPAG
jgi:YgiT-type zinc finger domain-containing protein